MAMYIIEKESLKDIWCTKMGLNLKRVRKIVQRCLKCPSVVLEQIFLSSQRDSVVNAERRLRGTEVLGVTVF